MTKIIKTTVTSANQKLAEQTLNDLLKNHGAYKIVKYKSRNSYRQLKEITAYFHNFFFTWNNQAKKMVYIETNEQIPEKFNQPNTLKYEEADFIQKRLINGDFEELENLAEELFEEIKQVEALKLINKSSNYNKIKNINSVIKTLTNQSDENIKQALIIEEKYSKHIWFIYGFKNGVCNCFANLNDNQFSEFGSVRFSDITEAFWLNDGGDDNCFDIKVMDFDKTPNYQEIYSICER